MVQGIRSAAKERCEGEPNSSKRAKVMTEMTTKIKSEGRVPWFMESDLEKAGKEQQGKDRSRV